MNHCILDSSRFKIPVFSSASTETQGVLRRSKVIAHTGRGIRSLLIVFCSVLLSTGCQHVPGLDGLVPAKGTVTLNGESIKGASLLFRPVEQGQAASGMSGDDGRFSLMTFNPGDGARPGEYLVTVIKTEICGEIRIEHPEGTNQKIVHDNREIINHLPEKYASPGSTDIRVAIPENGNTKIDIVLTGEVDATPKKVKDIKRNMY